MSIRLTPGSIHLGQLAGLDEKLPLQAASLSLKDDGQAEVKVPYVWGDEQYAIAASWFETRTPPPMLLFATHEGFATLTGLRWAGDHGSVVKTGKLRAESLILSRPRNLKPDYRLRELASNLDGLTDWCDFSPVRTSHVGKQAVSVEVQYPVPISFRASGFTYSLVENSPWTATEGARFSVSSEAVLQTRAHRGATIGEHLDAQRPIRALLSLVKGAPTRWRRHRAKDQQFPLWMLSGEAREPVWVDVIHRRTAGDAIRPDESDSKRPAVTSSQVGPKGLKRWVDRYQDETFRRAIDPAVEVINGASQFLEPQVMMLAMSLDAMGFYRDESRRKNSPMHQQIARCVEAAGMDLAKIGSIVGISKLIANTNNDLKHPDRPDWPDHKRLVLVRDLELVLIRAQIFDLVGLKMSVAKSATAQIGALNLINAFERYGVTVSDAGHLQDKASEPNPGAVPNFRLI